MISALSSREPPSESHSDWQPLGPGQPSHRREGAGGALVHPSVPCCPHASSQGSEGCICEPLALEAGTLHGAPVPRAGSLTLGFWGVGPACSVVRALTGSEGMAFLCSFVYGHLCVCVCGGGRPADACGLKFVITCTVGQVYLTKMPLLVILLPTHMHPDCRRKRMGRAAPVPAPHRHVAGSHTAAAEELCRTLSGHLWQRARHQCVARFVRGLVV